MKEQKIIARIILELMGSPKEHVENTLKQVLDKIKKEEKGLKIVKYHAYEAEQQDNELWSAFAEVELESTEMKRILDICFDYMPSSLEILEPAGIEVDCNDIASLFNDLLAKLHKYDMLLKNFHAENVMLKEKVDHIDKMVEKAKAQLAQEKAGEKDE